MLLPSVGYVLVPQHGHCGGPNYKADTLGIRSCHSSPLKIIYRLKFWIVALPPHVTHGTKGPSPLDANVEGALGYVSM